MIGSLIFPRNRLVSQRPRWIRALIRFLRGHVRPLDRRCRHSSHEHGEVNRVLHQSVRPRGNRPRRGRRGQVRPAPRPAFRAASGTELVRGTQSVLGSILPGRSLGPLEVRVKDVPETLQRLKKLGVLPATRKLWVNRKTVAKLKDDPKFAKLMQEDMWTSRNGHRIAYIRDPDGIFFCLYDHPEEPWEGPIPDHF